MMCRLCHSGLSPEKNRRRDVCVLRLIIVSEVMWLFQECVENDMIGSYIITGIACLWLVIIFAVSHGRYSVRQPKSFRQKCGMSSCVLCSNYIINNCDKNIVDRRKGTVFKVRAEILTLDYRVPINSPYICRSCLPLLKKRRALVTSLEEVNSKLHNVVNRSSNSCILPVSKSPTPQSNLLEGDFQQEQPWRTQAASDPRKKRIFSRFRSSWPTNSNRRRPCLAPLYGQWACKKVNEKMNFGFRLCVCLPQFYSRIDPPVSTPCSC